MALPLRDRSPIYGLLISMAKVRAGSALDSWQGGRQERLTRTSVDAGISVELMAKAFLAAHSPALLLANNPPRDTLLHLSDLGALATTPLQAIKTVGMTEAFTRVRWLLPSFSHSVEQDRDLLLARNSAIHLGDAPEDLAPRVMISMVRIHSELAQAIGDWGQGESFFEEYWDDRADAVQHLLDESQTETSRIAQAKVATARLNFLRTFGRLSTEERKSLAHQLAGRYAWAAPIQLHVECPACSQLGLLAIDGIDVGEPFDAPLWSSGEPARYVNQREKVLGFDCSACGLSLEGEEAAGAGLTWHVDMPNRLVVDEPSADDPSTDG